MKENFKNITIKGDTEKISFVLDRKMMSVKLFAVKMRIICMRVKVDGDTLIVKSKNKKHWHFNIGIAMESPSNYYISSKRRI